jgi:3-methyladenine DNA glycosylase AlkD
MNISALVEEIEERVQSMTVRTTPALRTLRREYSKRTNAVAPGDVVKIADALVARRRVPRFIADELIASRPDAVEMLQRTDLERLGASIHRWGDVDSFACYLAGTAWREGRIEDETVERWARSDDRWWRRAALVSTVPLNVKARGGRGDARRTLQICSLLIDDRDEMVVKALSWALRALADRDCDAVRQFLEQHRTRLSALVRREVQHKLTTGRKSPQSSRCERSKSLA